MPTLFVDYENGNDNHGGTSFALLASGTNGRISSSTFSAATANFPNDNSLINQYLSIFNGTSYVTYNITEWVSSTSLTISAISGGTALSNQAVDRQYFIGGRWKTISSTGATAARLIPGDTIRIMASPEPTVVGSGLWSTTIGVVGAAASNVTAATNATPIVVTCASTMATLNINNGDTVLINSAGGNVNSNGTWEVSNVSGNSCTLVGSSGNAAYTSGGLLRKMDNRVVKLNTSVTQNIASFGNRGTAANPRTPWIASSNASATLDTDSKEGDVSDNISITANFTTGKAAYKATGSLNLNSYQQLSFYIKQTAGNVTDSAISLRLCSDTIGDSSVHTFNVPPLIALNQWVPLTIDLGSAMSSSIQSVALYVDTDRGAQVFLLSNIIACKSPTEPDSLNLQSLIGKNTENELWYPIMSINNTRVMLNNVANGNTNLSLTTQRGGYYGITETVNTFKRETIKTPMVNAATTTVQEVQEGGTEGASFDYQFGWDRTNMSTRNSQTYFDGLNGLGYGFLVNGGNGPTRDYINISNLGCVRYDRMRFAIGTYGTYGLLEGVGNTSAGIDFTWMRSLTLNDLRASSNLLGVQLDNGNNNHTIGKIISIGNTSHGIYLDRAFANNRINYALSANNSNGMQVLSSADNIYISGNFIQNGNFGMNYFATHNEQFINCMTSGNLSHGIQSLGGDIYLNNCSINENTEFLLRDFANTRIFSTNHDNAPENHRISTDNGLIIAQTVVRNTNSGYAWAISPTSTLRNITYPLNFAVAKVAVSANSLVTIRAMMRRTNTGLTTGLRVRGGQIGGVSNDITSYMSAAANTWEQVTLTFTPTEVGVVEILAECYGGSTFTGYIDDISITQI